jgi:hypothetical protein
MLQLNPQKRMMNELVNIRIEKRAPNTTKHATQRLVPFTTSKSSSVVFESRLDLYRPQLENVQWLRTSARR